jgi:hypothetical protein
MPIYLCGQTAWLAAFIEAPNEESGLGRVTLRLSRPLVAQLAARKGV